MGTIELAELVSKLEHVTRLWEEDVYTLEAELVLSALKHLEELQPLREVVEEIRKMHYSYEGWCVKCTSLLADFDSPVTYPCPTIQVINRKLNNQE